MSADKRYDLPKCFRRKPCNVSFITKSTGLQTAVAVVYNTYLISKSTTMGLQTAVVVVYNTYLISKSTTMGLQTTVALQFNTESICIDSLAEYGPRTTGAVDLRRVCVAGYSEVVPIPRQKHFISHVNNI